MARSPWRYFTLIFLVSMAIRVHQLDQLTSANPLALAPTGDREDEAIAISLYSTGEFADPYLIPTGPTAYLAPLHLFILILYIPAGVMVWKLIGGKIGSGSDTYPHPADTK